jgi:hypothetical protein
VAQTLVRVLVHLIFSTKERALGELPLAGRLRSFFRQRVERGVRAAVPRRSEGTPPEEVISGRTHAISTQTWVEYDERYIWT